MIGAALAGEQAFEALPFVPPGVIVEYRADGARILRSPHALGPVRPSIVSYLREWAQAAPDRTFLAQRSGGPNEWRHVTYAEARASADRIGAAFLRRGLGAARPVMVLSANSIEHALVMLGALTVGIPVVPVSPAYSLVSRDHAKLKRVVQLTRPGLVFVQCARTFGPALAALALGDDVKVVAATEFGQGETRFEELLAEAPGAAVEDAYNAVGPSTLAKILFTSGSTGEPKGVLNTHGMLCANQQMAAQIALKDPSSPPIIVDWLPWHHTFGGNFCVNATLRQGASLYIDEGRPQPGAPFERTLDTLRHVAPTFYPNVPAGWAMLAGRLEADDDLRRRFFSRLRVAQYGGAALQPAVYDRIQELALRTVGRKIPFTCGLGTTETAPSVTSLHWIHDGVGVLGLPYPQVEMKLLPLGAGRYEMRVRGPLVFSGYVGDPEATARAFDEENYYRTGDACRFVDEAEPARGIAFDGRVAEDFKLATGTWVCVGRLRTSVLDAAAPLLRDMVIAGQDRSFIAAVAWPNIDAMREMTGSDAPAEDLVRAPAVRVLLARCLSAWNARNPGSSMRIARLALTLEAPCVDAGEVSDKGYLNQRRVLGRRAELVEKLYAEMPPADVIVIEP